MKRIVPACVLLTSLLAMPALAAPPLKLRSAFPPRPRMAPPARPAQPYHGQGYSTPRFQNNFPSAYPGYYPQAGYPGFYPQAYSPYANYGYSPYAYSPNVYSPYGYGPSPYYGNAYMNPYASYYGPMPNYGMPIWP